MGEKPRFTVDGEDFLTPSIWWIWPVGFPAGRSPSCRLTPIQTETVL